MQLRFTAAIGLMCCLTLPAAVQSQTQTVANGPPEDAPPGIQVAVAGIGTASPKHPLQKAHEGIQSHYPPRLPGNKHVVTVTSEDFLKLRDEYHAYCHGPNAPVLEMKYGYLTDKPPKLGDGGVLAKTPPTVDFLYYPGQNYDTNGWQAFGDSLAVDGKHYSAIGDTIFNSYLYEYDVARKELRMVLDVSKHLNQPKGRYTPGMIQSRIDRGNDGWLYFATTRGDGKWVAPEYQYEGDWILRYHPDTGEAETVAHAPVGAEHITASVLDPERLIFYGGTRNGKFFAYDVRRRKLLFEDPQGPDKYMMFARSTGRVYYKHGLDGTLRRYDPATNQATDLGISMGLRAATQETPGGQIYTVAHYNYDDKLSRLFRFDVKTEKVERLECARVGRCGYIASLDADPTGRYLYYCPGAYWDSLRNGSPLVQYDTRTGQKKVIALLWPTLWEQCGFKTYGVYGVAVSPEGDKVFVTWYGSRLPGQHDGTMHYDACALSVVHIPAAERPLN